MSRFFISTLSILMVSLALWGAGNKCVEILTSDCTGCGECIKVCPKQAVSLFRGKAVIDMQECNGCGICISICSYEAIRPGVKR
jgi:ferredoxin